MLGLWPMISAICCSLRTMSSNPMPWMASVDTLMRPTSSFGRKPFGTSVNRYAVAPMSTIEIAIVRAWKRRLWRSVMS